MPKIVKKSQDASQNGAKSVSFGAKMGILELSWRPIGANLGHLALSWRLLGCKMSSKPASQSYIFSNLFQRFLQISRETPKNLPKWAPDASKCFKNGPQIIAKLNNKQKAINNKASTRASEQQSKPSQAKAKDKATTEAKAQAQSQSQSQKPKPSQANASQSNQLQFTCAFRFPPVQVPDAIWCRFLAKLGPRMGRRMGQVGSKSRSR